MQAEHGAYPQKRVGQDVLHHSPRRDPSGSVSEAAIPDGWDQSNSCATAGRGPGGSAFAVEPHKIGPNSDDGVCSGMRAPDALCTLRGPGSMQNT
jgi:hypothetical protein